MLENCTVWRFIVFLLILFQNTLSISECIIYMDAKTVWDSHATVQFLKYLFATVLGNRVILRKKTVLPHKLETVLLWAYAIACKI